MPRAVTDAPVVFVAAELAPWTQVGGLGEVAAALPAAMRRRGWDVHVLTPFHARARAALGDLDVQAEATIDFAHGRRAFRLLAGPMGKADVPVHFLEAADFFETSDQVYGDDRGLMNLGHLRWLFLAAAFRPAMRALGLRPALVHVHDWHCGAIPLLDRTVCHWDADAAEAAYVLTVHNAAHQGRMATRDWREAGLRDDVLAEDLALYEGDLNLLKAGVIFSDRVTTVSPTHARELTTPEGGFGLQGVFEARAEHLDGILNGIDPVQWNPSADPHLPATYSAARLGGKKVCKDALIAELGLDPGAGMLSGMVARLTPQKGVDLVLDALDELDDEDDLRFVFLGAGDPALEEALRRAAQRRPGRVAVVIGFDPALAHRIEAGADLFLMPSRFEPCGLNQMISQRYGTLPLVHAVGGLADTVVGASDPERQDGFVVTEATSAAVAAGVRSARALFAEPQRWRAAMRRAMAHDRSWDDAARRYDDVWRAALEMRARREREDLLLARLQLEPVQPFLAPQREIPTHYDKDVLRLMVVGPRRIHAYWEVQGDHGRAVLDALDDVERWTSRWELHMQEIQSGSRWTIAVEGLAKGWFMTVDPRRRYRGELVLHAAGSTWTMARSNEVETPPDIGGGG